MFKQDIQTLAFKGDWDDLLSRLRQAREMINVASEGKGYTALHQAAWHGADLAVIGELLTLGADPGAQTLSKRQTPEEIAREKHPMREDLHFLLTNQPRSLGQILRKILADDPELFADYDNGRVIFELVTDRVEGVSPLLDDVTGTTQIEAALLLATGKEMLSEDRVSCSILGQECIIELAVWRNRIIPRLSEHIARGRTIPLEREWTVVGDLLALTPQHWVGLRGDPYLWLEMQRSLSRIPLPDVASSLTDIIFAAFHALTGNSIDGDEHFKIARFARGGMSGGVVSAEAWRDEFVPLIVRRSEWLRSSWGSTRKRFGGAC